MIFLNKNEKNITKKFLENGYIIFKAENKNSLLEIKKLLLNTINKSKTLYKAKINDLNKIHKKLSINKLNNFRVHVINEINKDKKIRFNYFNIARSRLYDLVGNELMMQKKINLSIQFPNDDSSLLPVHSDVWSGDSPYEINLWVPMVNCYKSKSMYILPQKK